MSNKQVIIYETNAGNTRRCSRDSEKAKDLHTCPYKEEINGDTESLCDCSEEETNNCAWDI